MRKLMISLFMLLPLLCMAQREKFTQEHFTPSTDVVEVLENQISLDIKLVVPPNFFGRNTIAKMTPVFRWGRSEICGKPIFLQGEMVDESYRIVGYKLGVTDDLSIKFDYSLGMETGKFFVDVELSTAKKSKKKYKQIELPVRVDRSVSLVYETVKDATFNVFSLENGNGGMGNYHFYRAQNIKNVSERLGAYDQALVYNPKDYRIANNIAMCYLERGDVDMAQEYFSKALDLNPTSPEVNANMCLLELRKGDLDKASEYLAKSDSAPNYNEAFGTLLLAKGQLAYAVGKFRGTNTNTGVLANVLNQSYPAAFRMINAMPEKNGMTYYLQALIGAKTGNRTTISNSLDALMMVDPRLYGKTRQDPEFADYQDLFKRPQM